MNTLKLFEAAGRLNSFKRAAEELNVTPSAISHGIGTLEKWLGVHLFARDKRSLTLTDTGRAYLAPISKALSLIEAASVPPSTNTTWTWWRRPKESRRS